MNQRLFLSLACFFLLVSLVAVPVLAATVTCPTSCSCLLPAEAKKIAAPGYCHERKAICGYDMQKNEKYCYEKPGTTLPLVTKTKPVVTTTPTTVPPQKCPSGCTCMSTADGKAKGLAYCYGQMTLCGKDLSGAALYCFSGTVAATAPTRPPAVTQSRRPIAATTAPVASCPTGCSCLAPEKADAAGMKRCSGSSAACSSDPLGKPMYCYMTDRATKEGNAPVSTTLYPAYGEMPPASVPATPVLIAPAPSGGIVSQLLNFFGSLFVAPQAGAPSQFVFCNGTLTNLKTDRSNCGSCGRQCLPGWDVCCRGTCTRVSFDDNNCGGCGQVCPESTICCQGSCTNLHSDAQNCGSCNSWCRENEVCCRGTCVYADVGGFGNTTCALVGIVAAQIAIPLAMDDETEDVPGGVFPCTNETPCPQPWMTCCSDRCWNLNTSVENCGSCGYVCPASPYCDGGTCTNISPLA